MKWFGDFWPSALTWNGERTATPIGETCRVCEQPFESEHDQGVVMDSPELDVTFGRSEKDTLDNVLERRRRAGSTALVVCRNCVTALSRVGDRTATSRVI